MSSFAIAERLWNYPTDEIIQLPIEIEKMLRLSGESDELLIFEKTEELLPKVKRMLQKRIQECDEKGVTPNFRFSDLEENRLIGCVIFEKEENIKNRLVYKKKFYQLINELQWKAFENLCLYIVQIYNFRKFDIGKRTKDGGLDFYGFYVPYSDAGYMGFLLGMNIRIFGQAKHRNKQTISEGEIRKFHTHYVDFLNGKGRAYKFVLSNSQWFLKVKGPLVPLFFTNSNFSRDAIAYANEKGIVIRDGEQIVEDVIRLSKSEPWFSSTEGKLQFNPKELKRFLVKFSADERESDINVQ
jgi:hypothetical protein